MGKRFGQKDKDGYVVGRFFYKRYKEHKLIWLYHYGEWPNGNLDHINTIPDDNRIENLREATHQQNMFNRGSHKNTTSIYKGVHWCKSNKKWRAAYKFNGKTIRVGDYDCEESAHKAYVEAVKDHQKEFLYRSET